jgi:carbonic anhydrase
MKEIKQLLTSNKQWASEMTQKDPDFFERLKNQQAPRYLWIGCSDSRVPANELIGLAPGEVFVHRNIAGLFDNHDINAMSVLHYAVEKLGITHILVCGHYDCGGIKAAVTESCEGMINDWLEPVREMAEETQADWSRLTDEHERNNRLCELNNLKQIENLSRSSVVKRAWKDGLPIIITGVMYDVGKGILKEMATVTNRKEANRLFATKPS